jgi:hypothetical protein
MELSDMHVHFESHQDNSFWYGTLIEFSRANSLTPGEMYEVCEQLERVGTVTVRGCGSTSYTLRRGTRRAQPVSTGIKGWLQSYAY